MKTQNLSEELITAMTRVEGLWPQNISPNRLAVLECKLAKWLRSQNLKSEIKAENLQVLTQQAATSGCDFSPLQKEIQTLVEAKTENFLELAHLARLNPSEDFAEAKLLGVNLTGLDLSGVNWNKAYLRGADLSDSDLSHANLQGVNLSGADLSGALLSDANLTQADLHRASLALANLSGANLTQANLTEANLSNCNLSDANLSNAILKNANLNQAGLALTNITNADFTGANVKQARLWHDAGLSEQVKQDLIKRGAIFEE